jgi:hypothetical protein
MSPILRLRLPRRLAGKDRESAHYLPSFHLYSDAQKSLKRNLHEDSCFEDVNLFLLSLLERLER